MTYFGYLAVLIVALLIWNYVVNLGVARAAGVSRLQLALVIAWFDAVRYLIIITLTFAVLNAAIAMGAGEAVSFVVMMASLFAAFIVARLLVTGATRASVMAPLREAASRLAEERLRRRGYVRKRSD